jgi:hypothetical protein
MKLTKKVGLDMKNKFWILQNVHLNSLIVCLVNSNQIS